MLCLSDLAPDSCAALCARYGIELQVMPEGTTIPSSYWGEREAGLRGNVLYARPDTPVHSLLHEAAHFICMAPERRAQLDRDAGGDDLEESAVCYLQLLLADVLPAAGRGRVSADMDAWGYSFRLGSTQAWFEQDAADARRWLIAHGLAEIGADGACRPLARLRAAAAATVPV